MQRPELKVNCNKVLVIIYREGILRKRAGGHRFPAGCCSCCAGLSWGIWDKRYGLIERNNVEMY